MRLVSWNIQHRPRESGSDLQQRMQYIRALITAQKPDVVALQEATPAAWDYIRQGLNIRGSEFSPREDGHSRGEGVPIFVLHPDIQILDQRSFWFSETPEIPSKFKGSVHPRVCSCLRLKVQGTEWWICNIHLDHRSTLSRKRSLQYLNQTLADWAAPHQRKVICGDFNTSGNATAMKKFIQQSPTWIDAGTLFPKEAQRPTFLGWGPLRLAKARIDLCLHDPRTVTTTLQGIDPVWEGTWISDHRMLVVDLESVSPQA